MKYKIPCAYAHRSLHHHPVPLIKPLAPLSHFLDEGLLMLMSLHFNPLSSAVWFHNMFYLRLIPGCVNDPHSILLYVYIIVASWDAVC